MHNMLLGGNKCLEIVIGCYWCPTGSPLALSENWTAAFHQTSLLAQWARVFLSSTGWELHNGFWRHSQLQFQWSMDEFRNPNFKHRLAHLLREGWRHSLWQKLGHGNRRDADPFRTIPYSSNRVTLVRSLCQKAHGPELAVLLGSFWSPAAFGKRRDVPQHVAKCPWCDVNPADQNHVYWECCHRLTSGQPADVLERRFGWPVRAINLSNLVALSATVDHVWKTRHAAKSPWAR